MTNNQLTKERLQEIAEDGFLKHGESKELARMALAEKASEPVILYRERNPYNGLTTGWQELTENEFSFLKENAGENAEFLTLYRHAQPAPVIPDFKKLARELVVNLVDCGGLDEGVEEKYLEWAEKTCRSAMLAAAPHDTPALNSVQSVATVPGKWIPVSERMPDENAEQQVLACFKGGDISTLYYFEGRWDDAYGIVPIRQDVTHWMPLPAAPQEVR